MMIRKVICTLGGAAMLALLPAPSMAQDEAIDEGAEALAALSALFPVEPLTAEQEARLPLAREIMWKVMPEGSMSEVAGSTLDAFIGPIMAMAEGDTSTALESALGYQASALELDDAASEEVLAIVDPVWRERNGRVFATSQLLTQEMMVQMEPVMRDVMAELYAIYFDDAQLADINAFYSTETGEVFARQSYAMTSDPRVMAALFADPDVIFGPMMEMETALEEATQDMPAIRAFADLSNEERARVSELTGMSMEELEAAMNITAEYRSAN